MTNREAGVVLRRDPADDESVYWHLYDANGATVWPVLHYVIDCVDVQQLSAKTVESRAYTLLKWYRFLDERSMDMWNACDEMLKDFRDALLLREAVNSSNNLQARRRTINVDLRNLYAYYAWLQRDTSYGAGRKLLGSNMHQITSSLNIDTKSRNSSRTGRYPLTFRRAGEHSKHRLGFVPGEVHRAALTEYFYETYSPHVANRNCLIFELAWAVGWRRGSILGLTTLDFEAARAHPNADHLVTPSVQKFGYTNNFTVPGRVVARILDFIDNQRLSGAVNGKRFSSELFLNFETGLPLTPGAVSNLFSRARRALGWPKGGGLHSWRRGFANAYLERELDARMELGLDTGGETLAMSLAHALGQESLASQAAYIRDAQRRLRGTAAFRDKEEHARLSDENARLRAEISSLLQALASK